MNYEASNEVLTRRRRISQIGFMTISKEDMDEAKKKNEEILEELRLISQEHNYLREQNLSTFKVQTCHI